MGKWIAMLALGVVLAGCQAVGPRSGPSPQVEDLSGAPGPERVKRHVAFPEQEYARLDKHGTATLTGQLFIKTPGGSVVYGAGETISIAPATTYSAEAAEAALAGKYIEPADPRAQAYTHQTKTDRRGYFKATGLPAGVFYVAGRVTAPDGKRRVIIDQVNLGKGETRQLKLSR